MSKNCISMRAMGVLLKTLKRLFHCSYCGCFIHIILEILLERGRNGDKRKTGVRGVDVLMQAGAVMPLEFSVCYVVLLLLMTVEHMKYP